MDIVNDDAKQALVDKETELGLLQECTPLAKMVEIAQLQKSGRSCPLLEVTVDYIL